MSRMVHIKQIHFLVLTIISIIIDNCNCSNILAIFPTPARSHQIIFDTILIELYQRGHNLTVVTQYPETLEKYPGIKILGIKGSFNYNSTIEDIYNLSDNSIKRVHINFIDHYSWVNNIFQHENMKTIWNDVNQYDLFLTEMFLTDAFLVVPYLHKIPCVSIITSVPNPQHSDRLGLPDNPSYIPTYVSAFSGDMTFHERLFNTFIHLYYKWYYEFTSHKIANEIIQKFFPDKNIPRIQDILSSSLTLVNTHPALNEARPLPPNVVEIGGIHVKPAKKLSQDLETFLNESQHGTIYFSMGSLLNVSSFKPELLNAFVRAFEKIPQRILWKFENPHHPIFKNQKNIKTMSWMPQRDILAHPNMKLFISHGGLLGITEAVSEGVPVLGIPFFADQWLNLRKLESVRAGKLLPYSELSEETILAGLKIVLTDEFKKNAEELQRRFKDRPQSPLDLAIYWIEYVIRHKGAKHLQPTSLHLNWFQYHLLDLVVFLLVVLALVLYVVKFFIRLLSARLKRPKSKSD